MSITRPTLLIRLTHTGTFTDGRPNTGPVQIPDLDVGYENQNRKVPVYVPYGGYIDIVATSRSMLSFEQGGIKKLTDAGIIRSKMFYIPEAFTTATMPTATEYPVGSYVWNTTENVAYWSNGLGWVSGGTGGGGGGGPTIPAGEVDAPGGPYAIPANTPVGISGGVLVAAHSGVSFIRAVGFYTGPGTNRIRTTGLLTGLVGVPEDSDIYLGESGELAVLPPVGTGKLSQRLGKTLGTTEMFVEIEATPTYL